MQIRSSETSLFKQGDFNIRLTLFDKNPNLYTEATYKEAWIKAIQDSFSGALLYSSKRYTFCVEYPGLEKPYNIIGTTAQLLKFLLSMNSAKSIRFTVSEDEEMRQPIGTWIVLIP